MRNQSEAIFCMYCGQPHKESEWIEGLWCPTRKGRIAAASDRPTKFRSLETNVAIMDKRFIEILMQGSVDDLNCARGMIELRLQVATPNPKAFDVTP